MNNLNSTQPGTTAMQASWNALRALVRRTASSLTHKGAWNSNAATELSHTRVVPLLTLPLELILCILRYLPDESIISLSLTCKALRDQVWPRYHQLLAIPDTKRCFLRLLENDLPEYLLCAICNKLFTWWRFTSPDKIYTARGHDGDHLQHYQGMLLSNGHRIGRMSIEIRDLILRANERGPAFGLPISILKQECSSAELGPGPMLISFDAKVVASRLVMKRVDTLLVDTRYEVHDQAELLHQLHASHPCAGLCLPDILPNIALSAVEETTDQTGFYQARLVGEMLPVSKVLFHCRNCTTDIRVKADRQEAAHAIRVEVISYQDFGNRSMRPSDPQAAMFRYPPGPQATMADTMSRNIEALWAGCLPPMAGCMVTAGGHTVKEMRHVLLQDWYRYSYQLRS